MAGQRICAVDGCGKRHLALGFCKNHYWAFRKYGDPLVRQLPLHGEGLEFLRGLLLVSTTECIAWPYSRMKNGYGLARFRGRAMTASRVMCILMHGEPPFPSLEAAHTCGNGHEACVNPRHLRWATPKDNTADKHAHGTVARGESVKTAKLTATEVLEIRDHLRAGVTLAVIARQYGVGQMCISRIKNGKTWAWL